MAHLVEQSLLAPKDPGANPVIGDFIKHSSSMSCMQKPKNEGKEAGKGPFNQPFQISQLNLKHSA